MSINLEQSITEKNGCSVYKKFGHKNTCPIIILCRIDGHKRNVAANKLTIKLIN